MHDLSTALTPHDEAWAWQRGFLERALERGDDANDAAILLQHPPTVTLGAGSTVDNLKFNVDRPPTGFEVRRCERGGGGDVSRAGAVGAVSDSKLGARAARG